MPRKIIAPIGWLLAFILAGCSSIQPLKLDPIQVRVLSINTADLRGPEPRYQLRLRLQNPNPVPLPIRGMTYDLTLNGRPLSPGVSDRSVDLNAHGTGDLELEIMVWEPELRHQVQLFEEAKGRGSLAYGIKGTLAFANDIFPLDFANEGYLGSPPGRR